MFSFPWVNRPYTESRMWPVIRRLDLIPMHAPTIQKISPASTPLTPHTQNSISDCPTPYRSFSFFDTLYIKNPFFEAHNILKTSDSFTHLPYIKMSVPLPYLLYKKIPFLWHIYAVQNLPLHEHTYCTRIKFSPFSEPLSYTEPYPSGALALCTNGSLHVQAHSMQYFCNFESSVMY